MNCLLQDMPDQKETLPRTSSLKTTVSFSPVHGA